MFECFACRGLSVVLSFSAFFVDIEYHTSLLKMEMSTAYRYANRVGA